MTAIEAFKAVLQRALHDPERGDIVWALKRGQQELLAIARTYQLTEAEQAECVFVLAAVDAALKSHCDTGADVPGGGAS
jgi:hypothetical protein